MQIVKDYITTEVGHNTAEIGVIKFVADEWWSDDGVLLKGWRVSVFNHGDDAEPLCQFKIVGDLLFTSLENQGWYSKSDGKLAGKLRYSFYRRIWSKDSRPLYCPLVPLPQYVNAMVGDERCDW